MKTKKHRTIQLCNYYDYYKLQSGGSSQNEILVYRGKPYQRGSGFFSNFRYAIPFLKKIGKETLDVGKNILFDIASGKDLKTATKRSLKRKASELLKQASDRLEQIGTGRKKPISVKMKSYKKNKNPKQLGGRKKINKTKKHKVMRPKRIKKAKKHKKNTVLKRRSLKKHRSKGDIFI